MRAIRSCTRRRSVSNCVSPSPPRIPIPPFWRDKCPQNRVSRGSKCCNCANSICSLPSRVGARCAKNVQNQRGAVEDLAVEDLLQVAALGRGKFVIEDDRVHVRAPAMLCELIRLPFADECARARGRHFLHSLSYDLAAGGGGQLGEFLQRIAQVPAPKAFGGFKLHPYEKNPLGPSVPGLDQCFQFGVL